MKPADMHILALMGSVVMLGKERANLEVLNALKDQGARVTILATDADYGEDARNYFRDLGFDVVTAPYIVPPRPYHRINPLLNFPPVMAKAFFAFRRVRREVRPTHLHVCSQLAVLNFMPALALDRTPLVYRCGDAPVQHNGIWRATWRFISHRANAFGAVSRYIADLMVAAGAPRERITVVYSRPPRRAPANDVSPPGNGFQIGFVGQVLEHKGPGVLVDAFSRVADDFPDARLRIAGPIRDQDGVGWGPALVERTMADPKLAERVQFLGQIEDVPGFFASCDITAAPTIAEEPMGNVVMEAKQAGKAAIIFRSGGFPEVIEHGETGYVCEEKSAECLAEALRYYLENPDEARRQGKAAKASLKALGVETFNKTWRKIYEDAAA